MADTVTYSLEGLVDNDFTSAELHSRIIDAIAWASRDMWRDSYETILREGLSALALANKIYGDARILVQHAIGQNRALPMWAIQRAYRFVLVARRSKWTSDGQLDNKIDSLVQGAKLATAFLALSQNIMQITVKGTICSSKRFASLAESPDSCGMISLPLDSVWH
jgi:hypothetical protein